MPEGEERFEGTFVVGAIPDENSLPENTHVSDSGYRNLLVY